MRSNQEKYGNYSNSPNTLNKIPSILGYLLLIVCIFLVSQFLLVALVPIPLTFLILRRGKMQWVIGSLLMVGTIALLIKSEADLVFYGLVIFGWTSVILAELFERGFSSGRIIFISCAASIIFLFFFLGMYSLKASTGLDEILHHEIGRSMSRMIELYEQGGMQSEQIEVLKKSSQEIENSLVKLFPAILIVFFISVIALDYFLLRKWLQSLAFPLEDRKPFWYWILPDFWIWLFIGSGVVWYLKMPISSRIGLNFLVVVSYLYLIQGVAIITYYFQKGRVPLFFRYLGLLLVFLIPGSYIFLTLGGLFDNWVDFRKLRIKAKGTIA